MVSRTQSAADWLWNVVQHSSIHLVFGGVFSIPGLVTVYLIAPRSVGYFLIGAVAMTAYVIMQSLDSTDGPDTDVDFSEFSGGEAVLFICFIILAVLVTVSTKLWITTGLAVLYATSVGAPVVGVFVAVIFPIVDSRVASVRWYLSISVLTAVLVLKLMSITITLFDTMENIHLVENISKTALRF